MGNTEHKRAGREEDLGIHGGGFSKVAEREGYTRFSSLLVCASVLSLSLSLCVCVCVSVCLRGMMSA